MPGVLANRRVVLFSAAGAEIDAGGGTDLAPVNITPPVVSGTAKVGQTLHTTDGTWQYTPSSYLYAWKQDGGLNCTGDGWSAPDYTPNAADVGFELYCEVTAQNAAGDSTPEPSDNSAAVAWDFSLATFTVDGENVVDGGTVNLANGTTSVDVYVFPTDPDATITILLNGVEVGYVPVLKLDASALSLSDGDPVATWPDSSDTGNDATQATSSKRPTFKTAILNGLPVVRFDGVDDEISVVSVCAQPLTFFIVGKMNAVDTSQYWFDGSNGDRFALGYKLDGNSDRIGIFAGSAVAEAAFTLSGSGFNLWSGVGTATSSLFKNGADFVSVALPVRSPSVMSRSCGYPGCASASYSLIVEPGKLACIA